MKKKLAVVLCFMLLVVLCSCGAEKSGQTKTEESGTQEISSKSSEESQSKTTEAEKTEEAKASGTGEGTSKDTGKEDNAGESKEADAAFVQEGEPGVFEDGLVTESYWLEGVWKDGQGEEWQYSYHVPQLVSKDKDASELNAQIEEDFGTMVQEMIEGMKKGDVPYCPAISWKSYRTGNLLSLVVIGDYDSDYQKIQVYHYDVSANTRVQNEEVLKTMGYSWEEFAAALKDIAGKQFDETYTAGDNKEMEQGLKELKEWTLSDENINEDTLLCYPDGEGLTVILPFGSPAGAGWYYQEVSVPRK